MLTRVMALALALADKGIRVNAVAPGTIATELAARWRVDDTEIHGTGFTAGGFLVAGRLGQRIVFTCHLLFKT